MLLKSKTEFAAALKPGARLLGLDVGDKTIGLALSDGMRTIASPYDTIRRSKFTKDVQTLKSIIEQQKVGGLVIGHPINMDGTEGPRCQSTRTFISNISKHIDLPMLLWDERMSTMVVQRMMTEEADMSRQRRAELVDKLAASYMLQGCLDSFR
ncbi:MAG: Holliday junction resolvase RuvX [Alphaproteobacteria bacterium]